MTAASEAPVEENRFFLPEDLTLLNPHNIPEHIAIIMDGNRRWAKQRNLPPMMGHWEGAEILTDVVNAASDLGVKTLTVYAFSTENWTRPNNEVEALMNIFECYLIQKRSQMIQDGVRLQAIGDLDRLPPRVYDAYLLTKQATEHCTKINLVLAMNYGGRDELRRTISKILERHDQKKISPGELTEEFIGNYLDTVPFKDPDLLIRTSGECRVSNFLLWQISYTEIYTTEVLWPDFSPKQLLEAIMAYQRRSRRKGGSL
ncbi:MAG: di-trans,poly-cis-decaprenylcistransferase [Verrucomicrobiota bacterium]|nr:di-trans,poly-cis-decaprenylcistransferase [Verrucomicrobiota bacterium]